MWDLQILSRVVQIGAVVAFVVALIHPTGAIQIGGNDGTVFRSWVVLLLAPVVFFAAGSVRRWTYRRQAMRRAQLLEKLERPSEG